MKKHLLLFPALLVGLLYFGCKKDNNNETVIPAGSVDALAKAILDAPECGTIRLAKGEHTESGTITISKKITLIGDDGAVLVVNTKPTENFEDPLFSALYVTGVNSACSNNGEKGVCIENIEIRPSDAHGGTGIYIEQSNATCIRKCKLYQHQNSVIVAGSDEVAIENNIIQGTSDWQTWAWIGHGIYVVTGAYTTITGNTISKYFFGAWISDEFGTFDDNNSSSCYIGVIPCAVPAEANVKPRANVPAVYTMKAGREWSIKNNTMTDNLLFGILLYDGADHCQVENNDIKNTV